MAMAIISMFITVPNPGRSFNGSQRIKTKPLIKSVATPIVIPNWDEIPCARTDHGAFPRLDEISRESPKPKINNALQRMSTRLGAKSHLCDPVQGVIGTVL